MLSGKQSGNFNRRAQGYKVFPQSGKTHLNKPYYRRTGRGNVRLAQRFFKQRTDMGGEHVGPDAGFVYAVKAYIKQRLKHKGDIGKPLELAVKRGGGKSNGKTEAVYIGQ